MARSTRHANVAFWTRTTRSVHQSLAKRVQSARSSQGARVDTLEIDASLLVGTINITVTFRCYKVKGGGGGGGQKKESNLRNNKTVKGRIHQSIKHCTTTTTSST